VAAPTPALHGGGESKWDMKEALAALLSRAEAAGAQSAKRRAAKVLR